MVSERQALSAWQDRLEEAIGVDEAATVVDRVGNVATRADLDELRAATRADLAEVRAATRADLDELRADVAEFRAATREDLDRLRRDLGNELKAAWRRDLLTFAVPQFLVLVGIVVSLAP